MARTKGSTNKTKQQPVKTPVDTSVTQQEVTGDTLEQNEYQSSPEAVKEPVEASESLVEAVKEKTLEELEEDPEPWWIKDGQGKPVHTTKIILSKYVDMQKLVADVLQISYLGGELFKGKLPQVKQVPYGLTMLIPTSNLELWQNGEGTPPINDENLTINVSTYDIGNFFKQLVLIGKKGFTLTPNKAVLTRGKYIATLNGRTPIPKEVGVSIDPRSRVKYSREELKTYDMSTLFLIGKMYDVTHRSKDGIIKLILEAQGE